MLTIKHFFWHTCFSYHLNKVLSKEGKLYSATMCSELSSWNIPISQDTNQKRIIYNPTSCDHFSCHGGGGGALKFQGGSEKKGVSRFKISKDWHLCFMCTFVHLSGDKKNVEELDLFFWKTIGSQIFLNIIQVTLWWEKNGSPLLTKDPVTMQLAIIWCWPGSPIC